jgi:hypothetical protein
MSSARRSFSRRSALTFVWAVAAFAAGQLALGLAVERWLPEVRDPDYAAKVERLRARRAEDPDQPLVLVLGSSRVQLGLRGGTINADGRSAQVFNFGLSGAGPYLDALCLRRLFAEGIRPDLLVLEVLPPTLNQPGDHPLEETWLDGCRLRDAERAFLAHYHSDPDRARRQWLKGRVPCVWHRDHLRSFIALDVGGVGSATERVCRLTDADGWLSYRSEDVTPEQRREYTEIARLQYAPTFADFRLADGPSRALDDILTACRQRGIPVALLVMPEGPTFRAHYPPSMRAGLDAHLRAVSARWGVPLIDAHDWLADDAFWDSHHLLPRGAAAFTERFEREALPPLLRNLPRR